MFTRDSLAYLAGAGVAVFWIILAILLMTDSPQLLGLTVLSSVVGGILTVLAVRGGIAGRTNLPVRVGAIAFGVVLPVIFLVSDWLTAPSHPDKKGGKQLTTYELVIVARDIRQEVLHGPN